MPSWAHRPSSTDQRGLFQNRQPEHAGPIGMDSELPSDKTYMRSAASAVLDLGNGANRRVSTLARLTCGLRIGLFLGFSGTGECGRAIRRAWSTCRRPMYRIGRRLSRSVCRPVGTNSSSLLLRRLTSRVRPMRRLRDSVVASQTSSSLALRAPCRCDCSRLSVPPRPPDDHRPDTPRQSPGGIALFRSSDGSPAHGSPENRHH